MYLVPRGAGAACLHPGRVVQRPLGCRSHALAVHVHDGGLRAHRRPRHGSPHCPGRRARPCLLKVCTLVTSNPTVLLVLRKSCLDCLSPTYGCRTRACIMIVQGHGNGKYNMMMRTRGMVDARRTEDTERRRGNAGESYRHRLRDIYFFLAAFSADLVTLPPVFSVLSTDLMTPTATV
jgi:hypothetical protein